MEDKNDQDTYVVCAYIDDLHTSESKEVRCCKCGTRLWCSPWNLHMNPICLKCIAKLPGETKGIFKRRDFKRAMEFIEGLRRSRK